jgi:hypothetical protein
MGLVVPEGSPVHRRLHALAGGARLVFFAGLPGTGKSLLIHQLAHLARAAGRTVHLLQWDTARPCFEASPAGARYPVVDGVTQPLIRKAVGLWVRRALREWADGHPAAEHLLLGETPLVGGRFIELARREDDATEPQLVAPTTRFLVPVPSREVRRFLESERGRRAAAPLHDREREDAPPAVLQALWRELAGVAAALSLAPPPPAGAEAPYDPAVYQRVYEHLLRHRPCEPLPVHTRFPTAGLSAYDLAVPAREVLPSVGDATAAIEEVERGYPDLRVLEVEIDRWYVT